MTNAEIARVLHQLADALQVSRQPDPFRVRALRAGALAVAAPGPLWLAGEGRRVPAVVDAAYRAAGLEARVEAFLYEMEREMTGADVVIARAGATTLSELAAARRAAILVPLPTATDDHQRKNAEVVAGAGAAVAHAALSSVLGIHLAVWLDCSIAGAMVVMGAGLFALAWVFSPQQGLLRRAIRSRIDHCQTAPDMVSSQQEI